MCAVIQTRESTGERGVRFVRRFLLCRVLRAVATYLLNARMRQKRKRRLADGCVMHVKQKARSRSGTGDRRVGGVNTTTRVKEGRNHTGRERKRDESHGYLLDDLFSQILNASNTDRTSNYQTGLGKARGRPSPGRCGRLNRRKPGKASVRTSDTTIDLSHLWDRTVQTRCLVGSQAGWMRRSSREDRRAETALGGRHVWPRDGVRSDWVNREPGVAATLRAKSVHPSLASWGSLMG